MSIYNLTIHPPNHPLPPSHSHVFPISEEARFVTSARTGQEAETRCNSTFMCRVQKVSLITLPASIHHLTISFRLKLRCDRGIPCGSCVKRGCGAICPDGNHKYILNLSLETSLADDPLQVRSQLDRVIGTALTKFMTEMDLTLHRFVLASTQELHEKITELCSRVRDLEDGLKTAHAKTSSEPHPLLSDELLRIKAPLQREAPLRNPTTVNQQEEENNPDVIDSFGTLAINIEGHTSYYGQFANSWVRSQLTTLYINALMSFAFKLTVLPTGMTDLYGFVIW
jgi:hypothetical protein